MTTEAVRATSLVKRYGTNTVLDVSEVTLASGGIHVIVGSNGAGKTTLMRIACGLERYDAGEMATLGVNPGQATALEMRELRLRLGFCPQKPYLFDTTAGANVEYPLLARGVARPECRARTEETMQLLGVRHLYARHAGSLSAGEAQRTSIARALVTKPELIMLDEPVANIDPDGRPMIERLLCELANGGTTVIVATHVLDQAYHLSADVVRLESGRVAPPAVENLLEGEIITDADTSASVLALEGGLRLRVTTEARGPARAAIAPHEIIISTEEFDSSARNALRGRITRLEERGAVVHVTANVGVPLVSSVTPESYGRMRLAIGSEVVYTFKASAVTVF